MVERCARSLALAGTTSFSRASLPSFSLFLSSSLTILKFRPHPIPFLRKVAPIISIIKTRCTAALCCLSPVFPDAFKPTSVVGAFSDQLLFSSPILPPTTAITIRRGRGSWQSKRWNFWLKRCRRCMGKHGDTTSLSTRIVQNRWGFRDCRQ